MINDLEINFKVGMFKMLESPKQPLNEVYKNLFTFLTVNDPDVILNVILDLQPYFTDTSHIHDNLSVINDGQPKIYICSDTNTEYNNGYVFTFSCQQTKDKDFAGYVKNLFKMPTKSGVFNTKIGSPNILYYKKNKQRYRYTY